MKACVFVAAIVTFFQIFVAVDEKKIKLLFFENRGKPCLGSGEKDSSEKIS